MDKTILYRKKAGSTSQMEEYNSHYSEVSAYHDTSCENFTKLPTVWAWRRLNSIFGNSHDSTWAQVGL